MFVVMGDTSQVVVMTAKKRAVDRHVAITGGPGPMPWRGASPSSPICGSRVKRSHIYKPETGWMVVRNGKVIDAIDTGGGVDEVAIACLANGSTTPEQLLRGSVQTG